MKTVCYDTVLETVVEDNIDYNRLETYRLVNYNDSEYTDE